MTLQPSMRAPRGVRRGRHPATAPTNPSDVPSLQPVSVAWTDSSCLGAPDTARDQDPTLTRSTRRPA